MTRRNWLGLLAGAFASLTVRGTTNAAQAPSDDAAQDQRRARIRAALPFPVVTVPGERAFAEWERLRAAGKGWPVIVGDDEQLDAIADQFSIADPVLWPNLPPEMRETPGAAEILAKAATLRFPDVLPETTSELGPPLGSWPEPGSVAPTGLTVPNDVLTGKPFAQVHLLVIPTARGWEVPAYLRWGGWNECPLPEVHVAALRHWHERFGVELVGIDRDTLNLRARRRPATREAALALADEQYRYCPDIVDQGVNDLAALAAVLMDSDWWYFWWD